MSAQDHDDPEVERRWCETMREQVEQYLRGEGVSHGQIGDWPAWRAAPYVSIWAIESRAKPGWVGWWVICGDLPTDYVSADDIKHPRKAMEAVANRWSQYCSAVRAGRPPDDFKVDGVVESPERMLRLLEARAQMLLEWAADDSVWVDV
jgi:hypothetical protein